MITIKVTGSGSKKRTLAIEHACRFYLKKLGFRKRKRELEIHIRFVKDMTEMGLCDFNDDFMFPEFDIDINKSLSEEDVLRTIAHELVHAKQFIRKELRYREHDTLWKGKPSTKEEWEIEAYVTELILYNEYINGN